MRIVWGAALLFIAKQDVFVKQECPQECPSDNNVHICYFKYKGHVKSNKIFIEDGKRD